MFMLNDVAKVDCMLKLSTDPWKYIEFRERVLMFNVAAPMANTAVAFH